MIVGIGVDLCDVRRIAGVLDRQGERFAQRVLGPAELAVWRARTARSPERGLRYLATRFSAKEAFSKAIGLGMRMPMTWRRCEVANRPSGQPCIVLHDALKTWFEEQGLTAHLTLTDEGDHAASFVVVERTHPTATPHPAPAISSSLYPSISPPISSPISSPTSDPHGPRP
jgi:holo-[acyl-carrier-protein] synthase